MNKIQALNSFWNSFGWKAYDEISVPENISFPYITYESSSDEFGYSVAQTISLYDRSTKWTTVEEKQLSIANAIGRGGVIVHYDNGSLWIKKASPWSQRMEDIEDDSVRRIVLNIEVEFID